MRNTVDDGQGISGNASDPVVLESEKETNVKECTSKVTPGSELASAFDNLKDFSLDFSLEWGVPDVPGKERNKDKKSALARWIFSWKFYLVSTVCLPPLIPGHNVVNNTHSLV